MADLTLKRGDTWPPLEATLSDQDGPIDLTTATLVKLILKTTAGTTTVTGTCTITDAPTGKVRYTWIPANTARVDVFQGEFEITWSDGTSTTVPNSGYFDVEIKADLG